ncbi:MAG: pyridoxal phosphate-dependent aminotransferase [Halobacteriota archaeon]
MEEEPRSDQSPDTQSTVEKGGAGAEGLTMLLCENPLPPIDEAIAAAQEAVPASNHYTEPHSAPLRALLSERLDIAEEHIHLNAGSELILRQLFDRYGEHVHLPTPTYPLFTEIAEEHTETRLRPEDDFAFDLRDLAIPDDATLAVLVTPNNPNGTAVDLDPLPEFLDRHPDTMVLVDEAFGDFTDESVVPLVPAHDNLVVTRTLSKAHSLAGFRVGYAVASRELVADLDAHNDAYPLARPSQAAAIATLQNEEKIQDRVERLRGWADDLASELEDLGITTHPSETYFFLADLAPHDSSDVADALADRDIHVKPLDNPRLGPGYIRVTTGTPEENEVFLDALSGILDGR